VSPDQQRDPSDEVGAGTADALGAEPAGDDEAVDPSVPVAERLPDVTPAAQMARLSLARFRSVARARGYRPGQQARGRSPLSPAERGGPGVHPRDPQTVSATMSSLFRDRGWVQEVSVGGVIGRWRDVVGDHIADHCTPETFAEGVLVVRADSSAWAQQLKMLAPELVRRMAEDIGDGVVREVRVLGPAGPGFGKGKRSVRGRGARDTWG
jgi:predicted nucleic acid-binding Zn ribbon protein